MFGSGSILDQFAALAALLATGIAVGGFIGHAFSALRGESEVKVRQATAFGGLAGLALALSVVVLSAVAATLGS